MRVPFNRPVVVGSEYEYMRDAIARLRISGDGYYTKRCSEWLEGSTGSSRALLTTSCTHAIEMTALLLDIAPGDEIIMPSFTFVSTANAFVLRGARPVFVDLRADTLNIDENALERAITPRTRAIVVVHYAGIACEMDAICEIAKRHHIPVIEDNAHGLFASYRDRPLGSFGTLATQSFHETKNVMCGEGGALLINDPSLIDRAEIIREKGTNRSRFFRGQVDKYTWVEPGSSYLPSELLAAFLFAQLENAETIQARRKHIWERYDRELAGWCERYEIRRPIVPAHCRQSYHLYYLLLRDGSERDALISHLAQLDVNSVFHYVPLHGSEYGIRLGYRPGDLPITESSSERLIRLPMYNDMSDEEIDRVVASVQSFQPARYRVPA